MNNETNNSMIADHLRTQFSNNGHLTMGIILTTTCAFGSSINIIVIYALTRNSKLRTPTNCCILSLVVSDFLMAFLATPMAAVSSFYRRWVFGHTGCLYYAFLTSLMAYISIAMLTMISITRYILTVKTHLKHLITCSFYDDQSGYFWNNMVFNLGFSAIDGLELLWFRGCLYLLFSRVERTGC